MCPNYICQRTGKKRDQDQRKQFIDCGIRERMYQTLEEIDRISSWLARECCGFTVRERTQKATKEAPCQLQAKETGKVFAAFTYILP